MGCGRRMGNRRFGITQISRYRQHASVIDDPPGGCLPALDFKRQHPGLASHPQHQLAGQQQTGYGGVLAFEVKGGQAAAWRIIDNTRMLSITANLGDAKTTITHPGTTTHGRLTEAEKEEAGIGDGLIRIAVGLEAIEDIKADLQRGLA